MKKYMSLLLAAVLLLAVLSGCGKQEPAAPAGIQGTAEEIVAKIYENHKEIELAIVSIPVDLADADAVAAYTGLANGDKLAELAVSETMMGQPYSLVVARVKDGVDAKAVAKEMYEKVDLRKWICVAADTKTAACSGSAVMFFMVNSEYADVVTVESILEAFKTACGGNCTVIG